MCAVVPFWFPLWSGGRGCRSSPAAASHGSRSSLILAPVKRSASLLCTTSPPFLEHLQQSVGDPLVRLGVRLSCTSSAFCGVFRLLSSLFSRSSGDFVEVIGFRTMRQSRQLWQGFPSVVMWKVNKKRWIRKEDLCRLAMLSLPEQSTDVPWLEPRSKMTILSLEWFMLAW